MLQVLEQTPLQPMEKIIGKQVVPLQACRGPHRSRYPQYSAWKTPRRSRCPKGSCSPWRACTGQGLWQELRPMGDPHWSRFILKDCSPWRGHTLEQEKHEEEGAAARNCYGQTATHHSSNALCCLGEGGKVGASGMKE